MYLYEICILKIIISRFRTCRIKFVKCLFVAKFIFRVCCEFSISRFIKYYIYYEICILKFIKYYIYFFFWHEIRISRFIKYYIYYEIYISRFIKYYVCHEICISRFPKWYACYHEICLLRILARILYLTRNLQTNHISKNHDWIYLL